MFRFPSVCYSISRNHKILVNLKSYPKKVWLFVKLIFSVIIFSLIISIIQKKKKMCHPKAVPRFLGFRVCLNAQSILLPFWIADERYLLLLIRRDFPKRASDSRGALGAYRNTAISDGRTDKWSVEDTFSPKLWLDMSLNVSYRIVYGVGEWEPEFVFRWLVNWLNDSLTLPSECHVSTVLNASGILALPSLVATTLTTL